MNNGSQSPEKPLEAREHSNNPKPEHDRFEIQIDRAHYIVTKRFMTGLELRHVPPTPIGPNFDLFEVVPGGSDRKIGDDQVVEIRNGLRFFTAPAQINPGAYRNPQESCLVTP